MNTTVATRPGITLAEVAVSTVLTGVLMVAALNTVSMSTRLTTSSSNRTDSYQLANDLLMEIMAQPYQEPDDTPAFGTELGEAANIRINWDDVDDYHGYNVTGIKNKSNVNIPGYSSYNIQAWVEWVDPADPDTVVVAESNLKRIKVQVTDPASVTYVMYGYRASGGHADQNAPASTSVTHSLRYQWTSAGGTTYVGSIDLPNGVTP